jgi:hypothetical protein
MKLAVAADAAERELQSLAEVARCLIAGVVKGEPAPYGARLFLPESCKKPSFI